MKKFLLLNGPNLNMLGVREPEIYGHDTLDSIEAEVVAYGVERGVQVDCFQSNHEGVLIDKIHEAHWRYDGIVYNPGAHTHYSYALRDAVGSIDTPVVEVHLSDINAREPFRAVSVIEPVCIAQIKGKGKEGYKEAIDVLLERADS
ncbi:MAG: type II 3-dehydroquinate dehydratase [Eggerthellaceae bacterium]|nr:type II 3-dehydroquinate dehydratase [Eggerthellaceae bacterium]